MFKLRVELEDGREFVADVDGRDIRRWEVMERQSFLQGTTYSQLHDLAWYALDRVRGLNGMTKAEYDLRCVMVKEEVSEPGDPTRTEATAVP